MATKAVLRKYAKTFRSNLSPYLARFSLTVLLIFFLLYHPESSLPVSAQSPARFSTPQSVLAANPPGGTVATTVQVPASMQSAPFNVARTLNIPPGFSISVYARIGGARFMAITPGGDLLVSNPGAGSIYIVRPNATVGGDPVVSTFVSGLHNPHDMVFHTIGATTYLYVSESNEINRYVYNAGPPPTLSNRLVVVANLPDASSSALHGVYGHQLKNIAVGPDDKLYVSIASRSNADTGPDNGDPQDGSTNPIRASIYQYNADGSGGVRFAGGLRNAEGLAFVPGTNTLWVAVNNRDNIACPRNISPAIEGCTSSNPGSVLQSYVNDHPPEEFTKVVQGANYGWPFCNPNPDTGNGMDNMPFDRDYQNNDDGSKLNCTTGATSINKGIQAHSAPLGLTFLQDTNFPQLYRNGAVIGLHGSWNRNPPTGYKVIYFPWDSNSQTPGSQIDLVTGWLLSDNSNWGRPVDTAVGLDGSMFISDDSSGTIYRLASYLNVTSSANNGSAGTLAYAFSKAQSGDKIVFDASLGTGPITLNITTNLGTVSPGVTIDGGSCPNGPRIILNGSGAPGNGLTLSGSDFLKNIAVQGFPAKQLIINHTGGSNKFGTCVVVKG